MTPSEILAEAGRRGLRLAIKGTDRISVSPGSALTEDLRQLILNHRQEILTILKGSVPPADAPRPTRDSASPWPSSLPGHGPKTLAPLTRCRSCGAGTWVRFGSTPICLSCARKTLAGPEDSPKAKLYQLLDMWSGMDEKTWTQEAVDKLKNDVLDVFEAHPAEADGWYRQWRAANPEAKLA